MPAYSKTTWVNGSSPAINATNLNKIEDGIFATITQDGSTSMSGQFVTIAGSATTPSIAPTGDSNTGVFFPAADTIAFTEGGNEVMRLDANRHVLINTRTASTTFNTQSNITANAPSGDSVLVFARNEVVTGAVGVATDNTFLDSRGTTRSVILQTNGVARFIIDGNGYGIMGDSPPDSAYRLYIKELSSTTRYPFAAQLALANTTATAAARFIKHDATNSTSQVFIQFLNNAGNTGGGQINGNGASQAAFGSFSDSRLKENIENLPNQLENINDLRPVEFDYKDGSGHQIGFIAQEMQLIYPDAVSLGADDFLTVTGWGKTEAILVKAIQELTQKVESLESRLSTLEGGA